MEIKSGDFISFSHVNNSFSFCTKLKLISCRYLRSEWTFVKLKRNLTLTSFQGKIVFCGIENSITKFSHVKLKQVIKKMSCNLMCNIFFYFITVFYFFIKSYKLQYTKHSLWYQTIIENNTQEVQIYMWNEVEW
jgi:hypothetical protein